MNSVFATSIWLYVGDVIFVGAVLTGLATLNLMIARRITTSPLITISDRAANKVMIFLTAWLLAALILFKFIILQGGPTFTKLVATGNHGSVQFSTLGEIAAGIATGIGLARWTRWAIAHLHFDRTHRDA
jgi:hypothetical protein